MVLNLLFHVNFAKEINILKQSRNTTSYIRYSCCENWGLRTLHWY